MSMEILAGISMIGCVGAGVALRCARNEIAFLRARRDEFSERLVRLRLSCFLTNEKGHRVRYVNASEGVRARAELGKVCE